MAIYTVTGYSGPVRPTPSLEVSSGVICGINQYTNFTQQDVNNALANDFVIVAGIAAGAVPAPSSVSPPSTPSYTLVKPFGRMLVLGHSHAADAGASATDYGGIHKIASVLQPARLRTLAQGGAILCWTDGNGTSTPTLGDGGWARVCTQLDRQEFTAQLNGGSTTLTAPASIGASSASVAARDGFKQNQWVVVGSNSTPANGEIINVPGTYAPATGAGALSLAASGLVNAHATGDPVYGTLRNYLARDQFVLVNFGVNDLPACGPNAQSSTPGRSCGLVPFQQALRSILARVRYAAFYRYDHPTHAYAGSWSISGVVTPNGTVGYEATTTVGGQTITITTPPDFPGGTIGLEALVDPYGDGGSYQVSVSGATTVGAATWDTHNTNFFTFNQQRGAANGRWGISTYRIKNLNPGVNVISLAVTATVGDGISAAAAAYFRGWGVEAPTPPVIAVMLDPRVPDQGYSTWNTWGYYTRSPVNNVGVSTQTVGAGGIAANSGTANGSVPLGTAVTIGTTGTGNTAVYPGDTITVDKGNANEECRRVMGVDSTTTLHVDSNFLHAHNAGAPVVIGLQDNDLCGGGYVNNQDSQGAVSVPGLWAAIQSVVNEFDSFVFTIGIDDLAAKNPANFIGDNVHYNDGLHDQIKTRVYATLQAAPQSTAQVSSPAVPDRRWWRYVGPNGDAVFLNSWVNFGSPYPLVAFYKDIDTGIVFVKGAVKSGTSASATIFTLPVGYWPSETVEISGFSNYGSANVTIDNAGNVSCPSNGSTGFIHFNGDFLAEESAVIPATF